MQDVEAPDPTRRQLIAETLLTRRLQQTVHLHDHVYVDRSLITCAEYQLFLDEQRARGQFHQPDHWETISFPPGWGSTPILGVRFADATTFCTWLTERDV